MTGLLDTLRDQLSVGSYRMCFSAAEERSGAVLALPNEFLRGIVARKYDDELRAWAESTGAARVELVVDRSLAPPLPEDDPAGDLLASLFDEQPAPSPPPFPAGVTTRLLAERGFWSLSPGLRAEPFVIDDLRGALAVEPGRRARPACMRPRSLPGSSLSGAAARARIRSCA